MSVLIEKCAPVDFADLARLERDNMEAPWTEEMIRAAYESGDYLFLKAIIEGKTVGYLSARICLDECELNNIAVDGMMRRKGVGKALLLELEKECFDKGITVIFLEVNEKNEGAQALYLSFGFTEMARRKRYYGNDDAIIFTKKLK